MQLPHWLKGSQEQSAGPATYVIGDIHGCLEPLKRLLEKVSPGAEDEVVFVGDYIDRGPHSREVVDYLLRRPYRCVFLLGNHERMLLSFLEGEDEDLFLENGGQETLRSYGGDPQDIPASHLAFFQNLRPIHETPDYLFVHAGIRPMVPVAEQSLHDLIWIRYEFIRYIGKYPKPVIFGHTPLRQVLMAEDRIGIDTGCVFGGKLTCLKLPQREIIQVSGWRG
jgi:serine/threonine protein phosphatase 1